MNQPAKRSDMFATMVAKPGTSPTATVEEPVRAPAADRMTGGFAV